MHRCLHGNATKTEIPQRLLHAVSDVLVGDYARSASRLQLVVNLPLQVTTVHNTARSPYTRPSAFAVVAMVGPVVGNFRTRSLPDDLRGQQTRTMISTDFTGVLCRYADIQTRRLRVCVSA